MDDIVDLEMEKVNKIIEKIESDPESIEVKRTELNLWKKIKTKALQGRKQLQETEYCEEKTNEV